MATNPIAGSLERAPMTGGYFRLLMRRWGDTPARRRALLDGTGVSEAMLAAPVAEISLFQQLRQIDNLHALLGAGWPFAARELWGVASHGAAGIAALTAPNVAAGFEILVRAMQVRAPFASRRLVKGSKYWRMELRPAWPLSAEQWRVLTEANFLGFQAIVTSVLGRPPRGAVFAFTGPVPPYEEEVRRALGEGVSFGAKVAHFGLPLGELRQPTASPDPVLYSQLLTELERAVVRTREPANLRIQVERMLATVPRGRLSAETVARALGVSRRTLVRRLAEAGTNFRDLLDREMQARARSWLEAGDHAQEKIAEHLGYADATSFSRACRRWFGPNPPRRSQPRKAARI